MLAGATQGAIGASGDPALVVIADDLTGAADTIASFAARGASLVIQEPTHWPTGAAVAVDTETRHCEEDLAKDQVTVWARRASQARSVIYKKVDSLGRGNIAAEVGAVLDVLRSRGAHVAALVAPAFPALGRTTVGGVIHADGRPLVRDGRPLDLAEVFEHSALAVAKLAAPKTTEGFIHQLRSSIEHGVDVIVADASTDDDLNRIVHAAVELEDEILLTGSGGLAA